MSVLDIPEAPTVLILALGNLAVLIGVSAATGGLGWLIP